MTRCLAKTALLLAWVTAVPACFGSAPPPTMKYFRLPLWEGVSTPRAAPVPAVIQVEALDVLPAYDHLRIVYRVSPVQLRHYRFRQWVVKPGRLFQESLQRWLTATGKFREVTSTPRPIPNYVLRGRVVTLEQIEEGPKRERWYAALDLHLSLHRATDGKAVWRARIRQKTRVKKRTPQQIVTTMTRDLRGHLTRALPAIVRSVRQDLASR